MKKISMLKGAIHFVKTPIERNKALKKEHPLEDTTKGDIPNVFKLHPGYIDVNVSKIEVLNDNMKAIYLEGELPPFKPGQYISVMVNINGIITSRPYSIASSPKDNYYMIIVKKCDNGFVSSYLLNDLRVNDKLMIYEPSGDFCYNPIRDKKNIVAICGGSGITPFISMAKAINDNLLDINLTIINGVKYKGDIICSELNDINNVKLINVLSEENDDNYLNGFITKELVSKYIDDNTSIFVCGSSNMYSYLKVELNGIISNRLIRYEIQGSISDISKFNYDKDLLNKEFNITIIQGTNTYNITGFGKDSIMTSIEESKIVIPSKCRGGSCGFCHSKLASGNVFIPSELDYRREASKIYGFIHPCISYPLSDVVIEIPTILKESYYVKK